MSKYKCVATIEYYSNNEDIVVGAKVLNNSNIPVDAIISVIEDDESGIVIDMKKLGKSMRQMRY